MSINGKEVGEKFNIAPISFDYETDATATGASPEPYEKLIFDVLNNDSTNYSHWHEVRASWQLIDRIENYGPKMEHRSMNTSQDPWDQLHPMISLQSTEPNGFGNLNLRIKETKRQIVLPTICLFLFDS